MKKLLFLIPALCVLGIVGCDTSDYRSIPEEIRQLGREVTLRPTDLFIYFDRDSSVLLPGGVTDLVEFSTKINFQEEMVLLEGYSSLPGDSLKNDGLAWSRVNAVATLLMAQRVPELSIVRRAYGETRRRHPNQELGLDQSVRARIVNREWFTRGQYLRP